MLGWIIVSVVVGLAIWSIVVDVRCKDEYAPKGLGRVLGILFMLLILLYPGCDYYSYRIEPVPRLEAYERTFSQTKELIRERSINLPDMEITKTLAGIIEERNQYISRLKASKRNPFCLFPARLDLK